MTCQEFLARFSEYYDRRMDIPQEAAFEGHLRSCASCSRYVEVVQRGAELLRSLPGPDPHPDFHPRLRHRLYHVDDQGAFSRGGGTSATTAFTALAMAILLGLAAWSPVLMDDEPETVRLPAIEVSRPVQRTTFFPRASATALFPAEITPRGASRRSFGPLWDQPNAILYRYSPLRERSREPELVRTGLD